MEGSMYEILVRNEEDKDWEIAVNGSLEAFE
jgi:hypothetical protein